MSPSKSKNSAMKNGRTHNNAKQSSTSGANGKRAQLKKVAPPQPSEPSGTGGVKGADGQAPPRLPSLIRRGRSASVHSRSGIITRSSSRNSTNGHSRQSLVSDQLSLTPEDVLHNRNQPEGLLANINQHNDSIASTASMAGDGVMADLADIHSTLYNTTTDLMAENLHSDLIEPAVTTPSATAVNSPPMAFGIVNNNLNSVKECAIDKLINVSSSSGEGVSPVNTNRAIDPRVSTVSEQTLQNLSEIFQEGADGSAPVLVESVSNNHLLNNSPMRLDTEYSVGTPTEHGKRNHPDSSPEEVGINSNSTKVSLLNTNSSSNYSKIQSELAKTRDQLEKVTLEFVKYKESVTDGTLLCAATLREKEAKELRQKLQGAAAVFKEKETLMEKRLLQEQEYYNEIVGQLQSQIDELKSQNKKLIDKIDNLINKGNSGISPVLNENVNQSLPAISALSGELLNNDREIYSGEIPNALAGAVSVGVDKDQATLAPSPPRIDRSFCRVTDGTNASATASRASGQTDIVSNFNRNSNCNVFGSEQQRNNSRNKSKNSQVQDPAAALNIELTKQIIVEVLKECNLIPRSQQTKYSYNNVVVNNSNSNVDLLSQKGTRPQVGLPPAANAGPVTDKHSNFAGVVGRRPQNQNLNINDTTVFPQLGALGGRRGRQARAYEAPSRVPPNPNFRQPRLNQSNSKAAATRKYVYRPLENQQGSRTPVAMQLQALGIKSSPFGVVNYQPLYDGSLSISFSSEENRKKFESELQVKGAAVVIPSLNTVPFEVRIHRLDLSLDPASIEEEVIRQMGIKPLKVELFPYKDTRYVSKFAFAVITCTSELYSKFREVGRLNVGWARHRVDTLPLPLKCKVCGLLGHSAKRCASNEIPSAIKNKLGASAQLRENEQVECVDCLAQNHINRKDPKYVARKTDHKRMSLECKTYKKMCWRKLKFMGDLNLGVHTEANMHIGNQEQNDTLPLTVDNLQIHNRLLEDQSGLSTTSVRSVDVNDVNMNSREAEGQDD